MTREVRRAPATESLRYSDAAVAAEVRARAGQCGVSQKQLAIAIGVSEGQLSHKLRSTGRSSFTLEELGRVADLLRAPAGWPFISWEEGCLLEAVAAFVRQQRVLP